MIAVIDYGAGNLRSVVNALTRLGYPSRVTSRPEEIPEAAAVILPGVGAAGDTMKNLNEKGLAQALRDYVASGRPFFGVCLGLQVLFTATEEGGYHDCLGIIPGKVKRLPPCLKVPHMGWNQVRQQCEHPVFTGIKDNACFYFVHSYYAEPDDSDVAAGITDYGVSICSVLIKNNVIATQFHPEKSGEPGLKMYDNFLKLAGVTGSHG